MKGLPARGGESRKIPPNRPPLDRPDFHGHPTGQRSARIPPGARAPPFAWSREIPKSGKPEAAVH
jgi:hypothetical protein